jgi:hypothetical protein
MPTHLPSATTTTPPTTNNNHNNTSTMTHTAMMTFSVQALFSPLKHVRRLAHSATKLSTATKQPQALLMLAIMQPIQLSRATAMESLPCPTYNYHLDIHEPIMCIGDTRATMILPC